MNPIKLPVVIVISLVLASAGFGGGYFFGTSKASAATAQAGGRNRGSFMGGAGGIGGAGFPGGRNRAAGDMLIMGDILKNSDGTLSIKSRDGSAKLVLFSTSTLVTKMVDGTATDLKEGITVSANGTANADGSVNAKGIQIRTDSVPPAAPATK